MSQRLEDFAKKNGLPLEFTETTKVIYISNGRKKTRKNTSRAEVQWTCQLPSIFMGQTVSIEHSRGSVNFYFSSEKTRKEAREKLVNFIRGKTLVYGCNGEYRFKVPKNIR